MSQLVLETQRRATPETSIQLAVVSSLARGIPRIAALAAVSLGLRLELVLPATPKHHRIREIEESQEEFNLLLRAASTIKVMTEPGTAYRAMVDQCDGLILVSPANNNDASIAPSGQYPSEIDEALSARNKFIARLLLAVDSDDSSNLMRSPVTPLIDADTFQRTDDYNRESVRSQYYSHDFALSGYKPLRAIDQVSQVAFPYFQRADGLGVQWQRAFIMYSHAVGTLAILAAVMALTQLALFPQQRIFTWIEASSLSVVVLLVILGRLRKWNNKWRSARYLAERIRSTIMLAVVGVNDPGRLYRRRDRPPDWTVRALREIWLKLPQVAVTDGKVPELRQYAEDWLTGQLQYHMAAATRFYKSERLLRRIAFVLFGVGVCVAAVHALGLYQSSDTGPDRLGYISVLIPIIGGAIVHPRGGVNYGDKADELRAKAEDLQELTRMLASCTSLASLQDTLLRAEFILRPRLRRSPEELEIPI